VAPAWHCADPGQVLDPLKSPVEVGHAEEQVIDGSIGR
jgi:hypothetical protein